MTSVGNWLSATTRILQEAGIETARLDALVLLEDVLGANRASLLAHPEWSLTDGQLAQLNKFITQREAHLPLAYIRGKAAFYGRNFYVSPAVLVPRPETEEVITKLLAIASSLPPAPNIVDVGTGSGCIGITAKLELPAAQVQLLDIDDNSLAIARMNAKTHGVQLVIRRTNLLEGITTEPIDVILANLPYVPEAHPVNKAATHEPALAIFSGPDGLDAYRALWRQIDTLPQKPGHIIVEALPQQSEVLRTLAASHSYKIAATGDFVQHFVA